MTTDPRIPVETVSSGTPNDADPDDDTIVGLAFWWSLVAVAVVGVIGGVAWYASRPAPVAPPAVPELAEVAARDDTSIELPRVPFTDVTTAAGIEFVHESGARGRKLLPETMGGGVAFVDYDSDGDADLVFTNGRTWPEDAEPGDDRYGGVVLYRNDGSCRFEDVTAAVGLKVAFYGMGIAAGDYDGDGRVDLYVSALGRNRLFRNVGDRFEDVTESAGVGGDAEDWSTSCGWFDCDNDGDLDLFVCNYLAWSREFDLAQNFTLEGGRRAYGRPQNFSGTHCSLFRNEGDGRFEDISATAGIEVRNPDSGGPVGKALGVAFADLDRDGWLDVLVANDTVRNFLFHNQRDGTFREVSALHGIAYDHGTGRARGAMGIDVAPFRNDDAVGVAIGNFANEMMALYVTRDEEMQFDDEAKSTGLGPETRLDLTFGTVFVDVDLDGRLDLAAANGHLEEDIALVQSTQTYEQPPRLFWNAGPLADAEFVPLDEREVGPDFVRPMVGRGMARADFDLDGDVDLVIAACASRPRLLRNDQESGRRSFRVDWEDGLLAVGSRVEFHLDDGRVLRRLLSPTCSYLAQCELATTVGLGEATEVERVVVHWPDRGTSRAAVAAGERSMTLARPARTGD